MNGKQALIIVAALGGAVAAGAGIGLLILNAQDQVKAAETPPPPRRQ